MALPLVTQSDLIVDLADETGFPKGEVRHFLTALQGYIANAVSEGNRVKIAGIVIEPKLRKAQKKRKGRNPQTGEEVTISAKPASVVLKAKVVKPLADTRLPSVKKLASL